MDGRRVLQAHGVEVDSSRDFHAFPGATRGKNDRILAELLADRA
jgi:hypothetical protein